MSLEYTVRIDRQDNSCERLLSSLANVNGGTEVSAGHTVYYTPSLSKVFVNQSRLFFRNVRGIVSASFNFTFATSTITFPFAEKAKSMSEPPFDWGTFYKAGAITVLASGVTTAACYLIFKAGQRMCKTCRRRKTRNRDPSTNRLTSSSGDAERANLGDNVTNQEDLRNYSSAATILLGAPRPFVKQGVASSESQSSSESTPRRKNSESVVTSTSETQRSSSVVTATAGTHV
jgi:hypothetical protein